MTSHELTGVPEQLMNEASDISLNLQRLASYRSWSSDAVSSVLLARAGLTYTGYNDNTVCDSCKTELSGWQQGDDPINKHRGRAPHCSFEADNLINIEVMARRLASAFDIKSGNTKDAADCTSSSSAFGPTSTALKTLKPEFREACKQIIRRAINTPRVPSTSNLSTPASNPQQTNDPVIDRNNPDFELLRSERVRLLTFHDWPERAAQIVEARQLAQTGLYFTGQADRVQCVFCRGFLRNWVQGDQPTDEHRRHFPDCAFVRGRQVGNIRDTVDNVVTENSAVNLTETDVRLPVYCCIFI